MHYVIADVHGCQEKYLAMLKMIDFSAEDTLFCIGDMIDRGPAGLKILQHMKKHSNIVPILGNHELIGYRCMKILSQEMTEESVRQLAAERVELISEWINIGGGFTIRELVKLSMEEREEILNYLREFWTMLQVEVNGKKYILVHGGFEDFRPDKPLEEYDIESLVWARIDVEGHYFDDATIICGHTPTRHFYAQKQGKLLTELSREQYCDEIYESKNGHVIAIDCACGFGGKLGCLCLETMERFYV